MASKPVISFPLKASQYAGHPVPSLQEWEELWKTWDLVTQQMIPEAELLTKPIKLRNVCLFYLGHIPTFLDLQLAKQTDGALIDAQYPKIFERGIDPDVDNPEQCHNHSEIPDEWPAKDEILVFQDKLRSKVRNYYKTNEAYDDRKIARALWLGFEHEVMHLETLLYMLVQSEKMLPPDGVVKPDFAALAHQAKIHTVANEWFTIPERDLKLGLDDPENDDGPDRYFGWDNEKPPRKVHVKSFQAKARPITNAEFAAYLVENDMSTFPASWVVSDDTQDGAVNGHCNGLKEAHTNGYTNGTSDGDTNTTAPNSFLDGKAIRTVFGKVPLRLAATWPVIASYDELAGCAKWMGGRIPTADEAHSIYEYSDELKSKGSIKSTANVPAVNGHLVNNGVEETPPRRNGVKSPSPYDHFFDLDGANVGFKHWHPTPVTLNGSKLGGQGDMGGVWEWTSTVLDKHEGFEPMKLYPVYTGISFPSNLVR